ncbi:MAG: DUF1028 domain-containing protein [Betaproteobacteria bacterium]|nr:DUF1028 domain-containing protein [Betaproteobacteria bacterium]
MTYSVVARCPRTGRFGIGTASYSIVVGLYCDGALRPNIGVTTTQAFPYPRNNRLAMNLLAQGFSPRQALNELLANDPHPDYRQIAIVNREGTAVVHSGTKIPTSPGYRLGEGYAVLGDMLVSQSVVNAIAARFESEPDADLEDRLLGCLEAGRDAGGHFGPAGRLPERSAAVVVFGKRDFSDFDLRVDLHDKAVDELRRVYIDYKPHAAYYLQRALQPRNAIPSMEFADMLKKQTAKEAS